MHVENPLTIPLSLLVIFVSAKLLAELFERFSMPGIVGEILAGVLVGPQVLKWMSPNEVLSAFSDLGLLFLLFRVGLEVKSSELLRTGTTAVAVAVSGVAAPFALGWGIMAWAGAPHIECLFTAAAMVATSVGITAHVLGQRGVLGMRASQTILGAALLDDILGLLVLALVSSLARGSVRFGELAITTLVAIGFTVLVARWGSRAMRAVMPRVHPLLKIAETEFALAMCLLFALSVLAVYTGVAAITGAFLAGMAMSESVDKRVHEMTSGVTEVFLPFFLAGIGMRLDLTMYSQRSVLVLAGLIVTAAVLSKFVACGLAALPLGRTDAVRVGIGMIPRGEVGMVVAQIGMGFGAITAGVYGIIVTMSVVTTLLTPPLLRLAYREPIIVPVDSTP